MGKFKELDIERHSIYDNIDDIYLRWLCGIIGADRTGVEYWQLLQRLHNMEFRWSILRDESRAEDGAKLRTKFKEDTHSPYREDFSRPASVLEVIIGLAVRMEYQLGSNTTPDRTAEWFWEMIGNLGLARFDDEEYYLANGRNYITDVINNWLDKNYGPDGFGGLFPLYSEEKDQRKVDLAYQMGAYLNENYPLGDI